MSHETFKNKLLLYFYRELSGKEREEFETHLSKCPFCRADLENLKAISLELNQAFEQAKAGDAVLDRILEKSRVTGARNILSALFPKIPSLRWGLSLSAAAVLVLGLGISLWMVFMRPDPKAYDYMQMAENLGGLEQDISQVSGSSGGTAVEAGQEDADSGIAMLLPESSNGKSLDAMDQEITEIQEIANGVFEL